MRLIRAVCRERGTTLIMVTHDGEIAQYADRVVRLLDGRVIENAVQEHPKEIALVQTLPDGTVIELSEGETRVDGTNRKSARA